MTYTLLIKLDQNMDDSVKEKYYNSIKNYDGIKNEDSGFDLFCPKNNNSPFNKDEPYDPYTINFMVKSAMIDEDKNKLSGYYLYPRSSISKYHILFSNHTGIIDKGYRGNLMAKIKGHGLWPFKNFKIEQNLRLFQICAPDLSPLKVEIVEELPESLRGECGFGSTGK